MREWSSTVGVSATWIALDNLGDRLESMLKEQPADEVTRRTLYLVDLLQRRLERVDPMIWSRSMDRIAPNIGTVDQQFTEYAEGRISAEAFDPFVDVLADSLAVLPPPIDGVRADGEAFVADVRAAGVAAVEDIRRQIGEVAALADRIDTTATATAVKLSDTNDLITQSIANANALDGQFQSTFEASQQARDASFKQRLQEVEAATESELVALIENWSESRNEAERLAAQTNLQLEAKLKEATDLVHAIGRVGLTAGFEEWEKQETKSANAQRRISIWVGLIAAAAVTAVVVYHVISGDSGTDWSVAAGAAAIAATLGGVARFAATESVRHRTNAVYARRTAIDLASFGPFIETLPDDEKLLLTSYFVPVFFGQATFSATDTQEAVRSMRITPAEVLSHISKKRDTPPAE